MIDTPLKLAAACPFQQTYSPNFRDEPKEPAQPTSADTHPTTHIKTVPEQSRLSTYQEQFGMDAELSGCALLAGECQDAITSDEAIR